MFGFIRKLFMPEPTIQIKSRLTADEVLAIAKNADLPTTDKEDLCTAFAEEKNGRVVWTATSLTKGRQFLVIIDDKTGRILESKHVGVR